MTITERLYYDDPYLTLFEARVVARTRRGGAELVALDRSAFYPEGGGQPADTGVLNGVAVLDVQAEEGLVWHTLAAPLTDDVVHGQVNWARRFDHMQQHHGQHLLSAAFERLPGLRTVSFHLGAAAATIDLDGASLSDAQVDAVEDLVNQVIWEDRPVVARFVSDAELASLPLRKPPVVAGPIRVVSVPDFDHSACGGTHPRSTGAVGLLHIRRWERRGEQTRVEFVCGGRALRDYRRRSRLVARVAAGLSVSVDELDQAVERLRANEDQARKQLDQARKQLVSYEARELIAQAEQAGGLLVVRRAYAGRDIAEVRGLAREVAEAGCVALLGTRTNQAQLVFARPEAQAIDCGALLRAALAPFGGRGGGQPALAQGGLPDGALLQQALDAAFTALEQAS